MSVTPLSTTKQLIFLKQILSIIANLFDGIIANFDISRYGYKENLSRNLETITVTVDNPDNQDNVNRALILLPSFDTFNNYGVRIERT